MALIQMAHIVGWMYTRDAAGKQPQWSQTAGEIAFWLDEEDDEIFSMLDHLGSVDE